MDNEADFVKVQESVLKVYNRTHETIIQPYIVICGELKSTKSIYLVIKNSIKYKVDSVCTAFDLLYKSFKIFSKDSCKIYKHVIHFFDYHVYEIDKANVYTSALKLVKMLNLETSSK